MAGENWLYYWGAWYFCALHFSKNLRVERLEMALHSFDVSVRFNHERHNPN